MRERTRFVRRSLTLAVLKRRASPVRTTTVRSGDTRVTLFYLNSHEILIYRYIVWLRDAQPNERRHSF